MPGAGAAVPTGASAVQQGSAGAKAKGFAGYTQLSQNHIGVVGPLRVASTAAAVWVAACGIVPCGARRAWLSGAVGLMAAAALQLVFRRSPGQREDWRRKEEAARATAIKQVRILVSFIPSGVPLCVRLQVPPLPTAS